MKNLIFAFFLTLTVIVNVFSQAEFELPSSTAQEIEGFVPYAHTIKIKYSSPILTGQTPKITINQIATVSKPKDAVIHSDFNIQYQGIGQTLPFDVTFSTAVKEVEIVVFVMKNGDSDDRTLQLSLSSRNPSDLINAAKNTHSLTLKDLVNLKTLNSDFEWAKTKSNLVTYRTYTNLFNQQFTYFLTGSNNVSDIGEYLSVDLTKPGLDFALAQPNVHELAQRLFAPSKKYYPKYLVSNILNLRINAKVSNNLTNLLSKGEINPSTGFSLNYSQLFKSNTISFGDKQRLKLEKYRNEYMTEKENLTKIIIQRFEVLKKMKGDTQADITALGNPCKNNSDPSNCEKYYRFQKRLDEIEDSLKHKDEIIQSTIKNFTEDFYPLESKAVDGNFSFLHLSWLTFGVDYLKEQYTFINDAKKINDQIFTNQIYDGVSFKLSFSTLKFSEKPRNINFKYRLTKSNSAKQGLNKYVINDVVNYISNDTIRQVTIENRKDIFKGEYQIFWQNDFDLQYIKYIGGNKIALQAELNYNLPNVSKGVDTMNGAIGFLVNAKGKGEKKAKFAFSVLLNIADIRNAKKTENSNIFDRASLQLRGSLPFSSLL